MNKRSAVLFVSVLLIVIYAIKVWHTPMEQNHHHSSNNTSYSVNSTELLQKSNPQQVARYIQQHHKLPNYYIRKEEARRQGWIATKANLCQRVPGSIIGGDTFANREQRLPSQAGRYWREADVNFQCGRRNSDRLLYSNDGLIYLTTDHYRSFKQVP